MRKLAVLLATMSIVTSTFADNYAIVGGKIHTMGSQGIVDQGTILVRDGRIESVQSGESVPEGYERIDASGKVVTPGFIGALTSLGLVEVSSSSGVVDSSIEMTPISNTGAALDVQYAVNPDSSLLAITRLEGMTSAATAINGSKYLFGGLGAIIQLSGQSPVLKSAAFMTIDVGSEGAEHTGGSRAALWVMLDKVFEEASNAAGDLSAEKPWYGLNTRSDVKALKRVIQGEVPLLMRADRAADIRQVIAFKDRHPSVKVVLVHGVEAWRVASELAQSNIPVIIDPEYNLPGGFDQMGATLSNAARLHQAGVSVAIGMDTHNIRLAAQHAGNAVANGLPHEVGLESLTRVPASIFGLDTEVGRLEVGLQADIVIWSGDPLEVTEAAESVFINGLPIKMESRQTKLRDRYLSLGTGNSKKPSQYQRSE
ncbi:amidohydrolase [Alteromonas sp. KC3]|uniref:amidohydrolase family protein n=1 Tax=unclassified Alteromonas TaxID=2614992 RepID=UPI001923B563|nr:MULTISPECIES: amidohydrolase family protein [unclassified Alteromonas]BCO18499.1 amidohydrolase [Alteromonas sp. KC3]BCO22460.1 amidohydrolase [Alteromonas sp. KC14]